MLVKASIGLTKCHCYNSIHLGGKYVKLRDVWQNLNQNAEGKNE